MYFVGPNMWPRLRQNNAIRHLQSYWISELYEGCSTTDRTVSLQRTSTHIYGSIRQLLEHTERWSGLVRNKCQSVFYYNKIMAKVYLEYQSNNNSNSFNLIHHHCAVDQMYSHTQHQLTHIWCCVWLYIAKYIYLNNNKLLLFSNDNKCQVSICSLVTWTNQLLHSSINVLYLPHVIIGRGWEVWYMVQRVLLCR